VNALGYGNNKEAMTECFRHELQIYQRPTIPLFMDKTTSLVSFSFKTMSTTAQSERAPSSADYTISAEEIQALGKQASDAKANAYCKSQHS
jgi:hypothetical protein